MILFYSWSIHQLTNHSEMLIQYCSNIILCIWDCSLNIRYIFQVFPRMKLFAICVAVVWLTWFSAESHLLLHEILRVSLLEDSVKRAYKGQNSLGVRHLIINVVFPMIRLKIQISKIYEMNILWSLDHYGTNRKYLRALVRHKKPMLNFKVF